MIHSVRSLGTEKISLNFFCTTQLQLTYSQLQ